MRVFVLGFVIGTAACQWLADLPPVWGLTSCAAVGLLLLIAPGPAPRLRALTAGGLIGFAWACAFALVRLGEALPPDLEGQDVVVRGVVSGLPQRLDNGERFEFTIDEAYRGKLPACVLLGWYHGTREAETEVWQRVRAGERWQLTVRLKQPHGNLNPHGYDYEAALFERGLRATGYVRSSPAPQRLEAFVMRPGTLVEATRERIRERIFAALPESRTAGVLVALVIGDQQSIDASLWRDFNRTGITHLVAISGLHVTMIASFAALLAGWLWRRAGRAALYLPAQKVAVLVGVLAAWAYCLLAGFAVPAQRTLYMLLVVALALWLGRRAAGGRVLALALLVVLVWDPLAVRAAGFWLSFGAVALLFLAGSGRVAPVSRWREALQAQWAVTLGMLPLLLGLFQQFSLVSPLANAVAIPLVSLCITPLALLGSALDLTPLLQLADWLTRVLVRGLGWLAAQPWAVWQQAAPPLWAVTLGVIGALLLILPRGVPGRLLGLPLVLPLLLATAPRVAPGEARIVVLDVGQGLAVHVQTATHDLIYDTGPQFSLEANSGNRIIVPYLRAEGVQRLDRLIVTHQDRDHSGGAASLLEEVRADLVQSSIEPDSPARLTAPDQRACVEGESWEWDGVRFEMLHPRAAAYTLPVRKTNDLSCTLKITAQGRSMLLTGDIEAVSEADLVARYGAALKSDVLLVPHHGSRTSSTELFLDAVAAPVVVFPVGYRNRFRHPNGEVLARHVLRAQSVHRTDRDGAVTVTLGAQLAIDRERARYRRYWQPVPAQ